MTEKIKYIENLIAETKDGIKHWEAQLEEDKTEFDKSITRGYIQAREKKLNLLESIKKDLKALEILKKKSIIKKEIGKNELIGNTWDIIYLISQLLMENEVEILGDIFEKDYI